MKNILLLLQIVRKLINTVVGDDELHDTKRGTQLRQVAIQIQDILIKADVNEV